MSSHRRPTTHDSKQSNQVMRIGTPTIFVRYRREALRRSPTAKLESVTGGEGLIITAMSGDR